MKTHKATKGKVYVHKENIKFYGRQVIIKEDDPYTIEDFELVDEKSHKEQLTALYIEEEEV